MSNAYLLTNQGYTDKSTCMMVPILTHWLFLPCLIEPKLWKFIVWRIVFARYFHPDVEICIFLLGGIHLPAWRHAPDCLAVAGCGSGCSRPFPLPDGDVSCDAVHVINWNHAA